MVDVVGEDTVVLKGTRACVICGVRFCIAAVVPFVAEIIGATFCGGVTVFGEGVHASVFCGCVFIFGFAGVISSGGGLSLGGEVIISGSVICILDGKWIFDFCEDVSIFDVTADALKASPDVLELFWPNGDFASPILAVFGVLFPGCDVAHSEVTFNKSLLTPLCD